MCQKRDKGLANVCEKSCHREARRIQRLRPAPPVHDSQPIPTVCPLILSRGTQQRVLFEIVLRTASLMRRNKLIQEKMAALKQETKDFMKNVTASPENKQRYSEHIKIYSNLLRQTQQLQLQHRPLIDCIRFPDKLKPKPR